MAHFDFFQAAGKDAPELKHFNNTTGTQKIVESFSSQCINPLNTPEVTYNALLLTSKKN